MANVQAAITVGPMIVRMREAIVGSPVNACTTAADRTDTGRRGDPAQPARVDVAVCHGEPEDDEGDAGERQC